MSGPWEKYGAAPAAAASDTSGPWAKYGASQSPADQVPGGGLAGNRNAGKPAQDDGPRDNLLGVLVSPVDAALSAGSSMLGRAVGNVAGVGKSIIDGKYGTAQGANEAEQYANQVADKITRQPATNTGRKILEGLATVAEPLAALPTATVAELGAAARSSGSAIRGLALPSAAVQDAADASTLASGQPGTLRQLVAKPQPTLSGVGAAAATEEAQRVARAQSLPVPVTMTKGQRTRDFQQVQFEKETAKLPEGAPLRNRDVEQNQQLLQNFDALRDETGAQAPTLRAAGQVVDKAVVSQYQAAKAKVRAAYDEARQAGELAEPVPYKDLSDYLDKHSAEIETNNVPMLAALRAKLAKLDPEGTGSIPLNDMEELRKMAGRLTTPGTPNAAHIGDVKSIIDSATENAGGDLYQGARRLNAEMASQFKNIGTVDKLIRTKPGTSDRAVAFEDVVDHVIFNGSTDDVAHVQQLLGKGGEQGAQAWGELKAGTLDKLRDAMFPAGGVANTAGDTTARYAGFARQLNALDREGKLELIFGKAGAEKLRDFGDTARDILTVPNGTVNTSNTASALLNAWNKAAAIGQGTPGLSTAAKFIDKKVQSAVLKRRVDTAVNPDKGN